VVPSRNRARWVALRAAGLPCVVVVSVYGELSTPALVAVALTGALLAVVGLVRRAGLAAPAVGRRGVAWLGWLAAAMALETLTLLDDDLRTLSDLLDPVLAHPAARGAATASWLAAGAWLVTRPGRPDGER
jgi:hypothetical protein